MNLITRPKRTYFPKLSAAQNYSSISKFVGMLQFSGDFQLFKSTISPKNKVLQIINPLTGLATYSKAPVFISRIFIFQDT